jgi:hypothetical protein
VAKQNQNKEHFLVERPEEPKKKRITKTNKAPSSTPTFLPTPSISDSLSYLSTSPASTPLPICLSVADHGQVRTLPYPSFRRYFNLVLYLELPHRTKLCLTRSVLSVLSAERECLHCLLSSQLFWSRYLSNPITLTTPITFLNALLTTRRVITTGTCLTFMQDQMPVSSMTRASPTPI